MIRKINFTNYFSEFIHQVPIKFRFWKALQKKCLKVAKFWTLFHHTVSVCHFDSCAIGWSILQNICFSDCLCFESSPDRLFYVWRYLTDDSSGTILYCLTYCFSRSAWRIFVVVRTWLGGRPKGRACRIQPEAVIIQHEQIAKLIFLSQVGDHKAILNHTQKYKRHDYRVSQKRGPFLKMLQLLYL